jgi:hypothetical protein
MPARAADYMYWKQYQTLQNPKHHLASLQREQNYKPRTIKRAVYNVKPQLHTKHITKKHTTKINRSLNKILAFNTSLVRELLVKSAYIQDLGV